MPGFQSHFESLLVLSSEIFPVLLHPRVAFPERSSHNILRPEVPQDAAMQNGVYPIWRDMPDCSRWSHCLHDIRSSVNWSYYSWESLGMSCIYLQRSSWVLPELSFLINTGTELLLIRLAVLHFRSHSLGELHLAVPLMSASGLANGISTEVA